MDVTSELRVTLSVQSAWRRSPVQGYQAIITMRKSEEAKPRGHYPQLQTDIATGGEPQVS
jgi:hypothetical protein